VYGFTGVLLEVQAGDSDFLGTLPRGDLNVTPGTDGPVELGYLVGFREVRIKIIFSIELLYSETVALSARPAMIAFLSASSFSTGKTPGRPRQTGHVCELGSALNVVEHPQNILVRVFSWTCTSRPIPVRIPWLPRDRRDLQGKNEIQAPGRVDGTMPPM
jgi:hypothetical protein